MIRRVLMRRGVYTGVYTGWHQGGDIYPPRPAFYVVVNHKSSGMVRLEVGIASRTFWADWGNGA